jgi:hypoxanthine phosphoribosyltransferase
MDAGEDIQNVLIQPEAIRKKVQALGRQISEDYGTRTCLPARACLRAGFPHRQAQRGRQADSVVLIGILKGAMFFLADLARAITSPVEIELMSISSYGFSTRSSGVVRILKDLDVSITDRHVLIVEDIVDTGLTLSYLLCNLQARHPKSLRVCTLLDKPARRSVDVSIAYLGFTIPDEFVVGYGLDFNQRYRNLPFIGVLKAECYGLDE